jgi:4-alpha-glucanotransferase
LRSYCNDNGIRLLGDIPIYVAGDSADVWADPGMFQVDGERRPVKVAGVPPDYFSEDGQLWGNPCYQWKAHKKEGYAWWVQRMWSVARRFDMVRLDHFIGFARYYAIEAGAPNAREGTWEKGPGKGLFRALRRKVPGLQIIAEDLGVVSPAVKRLLKWSGFPGMQVLQFAFEGKSDDPGLPDNVGENCAYYTGTHDNDTTLGWIHSLDGKHRKKVRKALKIKKDAEILPAMIQSVLGSRAKLAAIPMQDYLGLDTEARMNLPGSVGGGNWRWRMEPGAANDALARRIAELNRKTGRGRKT